MKATKKILSLFNLLLFVGTFLFTSVNAFAAIRNQNSINHSQKQFSAKEDRDNGGCYDSFFEKNENETETERDVQIPALLLPFLLSFSQFEVLQPTYVTVAPATSKHSTPIYLSVCNFRV